MSYILAPWERVKGDNAFPEFEKAMSDLEKAAINRAEKIWAGWSFGGTEPGDKEFGIRPIPANEMANDVAAQTLSGTYNFKKTLGSTGWVNLFNYKVMEDVIHAFAGFGVTDEVLRLLQLRMELGDRKFPIMDIQEAKAWGNFLIIFKTDEGKELIMEPRRAVQIRGYVEATGQQTIVPIGFSLYRNKDLTLSET